MNNNLETKIENSTRPKWIESLLNWASEDNFQPILVGTNCCGIQLSQISATTKENKMILSSLDSPLGISDLLLINGTINRKLLPKVIEAYEQLGGNRYVMTLGSCTKKMCYSDHLNIGVDINKFIPVDIHVPGCPPTQRDFYQGLKELKNKR